MRNFEAWDPGRVLGELDKLIVSVVPKDRPSLVVALAARLAQLGVGLVAPTTNGKGGMATTEAEMPSPFLPPLSVLRASEPSGSRPRPAAPAARMALRGSVANHRLMGDARHRRRFGCI